MVGPDYKRPAAPVSVQFKELPGWQPARPADAADRGPWWRIYNDPVLDGLERQVAAGNQTLRAQEAAYRQAVAVVAETRAALFPTVAVAPSIRYGNSRGGGTTVLTSPSLGNSATSSGSTGSGNAVTATTSGNGTSGAGSTSGRVASTATVEGTVDWEIDLWGRIRRQVESSVAAAQASAADVANVKLSAESQLAIDYFELRAVDALAALLTRTVSDYETTLRITQNQFNAGVAAQGDVITAQAQAEAARAQLVNAGVQRAELEHAIAVLTGHPPADLSIAAAPLPEAVPAPPVAVPSVLLQRRPDIASAERVMQEQNALIGAAVAAFYPDITLSALYGFTGDPLSGLFSTANRIWSLGGAASETLFAGGARTAAVAEARAAYDQAVAQYRQTVLSAFEAVEDQLSTLRILQQQAEVEDRAVQLAQRSVQIALNQYRAGTVNYTTVVTQQAALLSDQQAVLTVLQNRYVASVTLVTALGGGWNATSLPDRDSLQRFNPLLP